VSTLLRKTTGGKYQEKNYISRPTKHAKKTTSLFVKWKMGVCIHENHPIIAKKQLQNTSGFFQRWLLLRLFLEVVV
jgi:hypothetical protein